VASKTVVELFDDLDGGRANETVIFALDGVDYEIDLSTANATALRDGLTEFIGHAHRVPNRTKRANRASEPAKVEASPAPIAPVKPVKNGKPVKAGKSEARPSASMTEEIRRLASESARKVSEANRVVVDTEDVEPDLFNTAPVEITPQDNARPVGEVGPVRALIIPFQEAGL
jgi:hypothetical protein